MNLFKISLAVVLFMLPESLAASFFRSPIRNVTPDIYKGGSQIWDISHGPDDYVFFAAGFEFTVWDGVRWDSYLAGRGRFARAVGYDGATERIYCAGDNFYGYWNKDESGDFVFTALYSNEDLSNWEVFWRAVPADGGAYFQTHESIIWYDAATGRSEYMITGSDVGYIFDTDGGVYAQCDGRVFLLDGTSMTPAGAELDDRIVWIDRTDDGRMIVISEKKGILVCYGGGYSELDPETNRLLSQLNVFAACALPGGDYLVGTVLNGAYIVDRSGRITDSFNDSTGLDFTTVLSVGAGAGRSIWLGLDGAIACIPDNSGERYYNSMNIKIGNVYASLIAGNSLYLGTNKGLFVVEDGHAPRFVDNTQGQVWDICRCGNDIIVSHDRGLFKLSGTGRLEMLMPDSWRIDRWTGDRDLYYIADRNGFVLFTVSDGRFVFRNRIENYSGYYSNAKVDKYGNMWISGLEGEVRRLTLDRNRRRVESSKIYALAGVRNWIGMSMLDGDVVFISDMNCYSYDPQMDAIVRNDYYTHLVSLFGSESINIFQADNYFFNIGSQNVGVVRRDANDFSGVRNIFMDADSAGPPAGFRRFQRLNDSIVAYGYANGAAFYHFGREWRDSPDSIKLRKLEYSLYGNTALLAHSRCDSLLHLPNRAANIKMFFTGVSRSHNLSYSLDGAPWERMSAELPLQFDYLGSGEHVLLVRSNAPDSPGRRFVISIEKHFTATAVFAFMMVGGVALLCCLGKFIYNRRVDKLEIRYRRQQGEALERVRINHENEMLSLELRERDRQLATFAINDVGINAMLDDIDSRIANALRADPEMAKNLGDVRAAVRKHRRGNGNWKVFETYFNGAYDGFLNKLVAKYPQLTNNDLKICAFIKLGMSTKEIAAFLNIETASAESARYRLRKNMGLPQSESLSKLLNRI